MGWLFYVVDEERMPYPAVAAEIKKRTGIPVDPSNVFRLVRATRAEYQDRQVAEIAINRKLEGTVSGITEGLLDRRMLYLSAKGDLDASETAELSRLMLQRKQLDVRRMEAASNLYKIQQAGAEFVADILKDEAKAEEARRLAANRALTGSQYVEKIRQLVYGPEAVAKPDGIPDIRDVIEVVNGKPAVEVVLT